MFEPKLLQWYKWYKYNTLESIPGSWTACEIFNIRVVLIRWCKQGTEKMPF